MRDDWKGSDGSQPEKTAYIVRGLRFPCAENTAERPDDHRKA